MPRTRKIGETRFNFISQLYSTHGHQLCFCKTGSVQFRGRGHTPSQRFGAGGVHTLYHGRKCRGSPLSSYAENSKGSVAKGSHSLINLIRHCK